MIKDITVSTIQTSVKWEDPNFNKGYLYELVEEIDETDLIIFPEMFSTGFTMNAVKVAESMEGPTMQWMHSVAQLKNAVTTGSIVIKENKDYYNRLIWMCPDGKYQYYDKRHLFSFANEHDHYTRGNSRLIVDLMGWKICPLICYDLRFPVWSRNDCRYDLLIYVANWPEKRIQDWDRLLHARSIENLTYTIGVNIIGFDKNGNSYNGHTSVIAPGEKGLVYCRDNEVAIDTSTLELQYLLDHRKKYSFLNDRDNFDIKV